MRFSLLKHSIALALCAAPWLAHAARPMNTDDARLVDDKSCQVESWAKRIDGHTEFWAQPACNFTGNLELTVGGAWARQAGSTQRLTLRPSIT